MRSVNARDWSEQQGRVHKHGGRSWNIFVCSDKKIDTSDIANRVMKDDTCFCGYGSPKFISHTEL